MMLKFILFILLVGSCSKVEAYKYKLAICAIFRDEARFLKEWIDYHRAVGVEHFWLYNNSSSDSYKKVLAPYIKAGIVELFQRPSKPEQENQQEYTYTIQCGAYNDALNRARKVSKWLALIDIDEFVVPVNDDSIVDVMENYFSDVSGLYINWIFYGSSGVKKIKKGEYLIEKLTHRAELSCENHTNGKCIVNPLHVVSCPNPHFCNYKDGKYHVDAGLYPCGMRASGLFIDKIRINHYWTKDLKFMHDVKIPRVRKWGLPIEDVLHNDQILNVVEDHIMDRFVEKLK